LHFGPRSQSRFPELYRITKHQSARL